MSSTLTEGSLTIIPRKVTKVVGIIVDPDPKFLSIVPHGANQTPWAVVKTDDKPTEPNLTNEDSRMKLKVSKSAASTSADLINKFAFKGDKFPDDASVSLFLSDLGFGNLRIEKTDTGFDVLGVDASEFEGVSPIDFTDGGDVQIYVGKRKATEDNGTGTENKPVVTDASEQKDDSVKSDKAPPKRTSVVENLIRFENPIEVKRTDSIVKYDSYYSYYVDTSSLADVITASTQDGFPVGFTNVEDAFRKAVSVALKAGKTSSIPALAKEYGAILVKLADIVQNVAQKSDAESTSAIAALFGITSDKEPEPEKKEETKSNEKEQPPIDMATVIAEAVSKSLQPIIEQQASMQKTIAESATRLAKVEELRQTRKGADLEDVTPEDGKTDSKKDAKPDMSRFRKSALGMRH